MVENEKTNNDNFDLKIYLYICLILIITLAFLGGIISITDTTKNQIEINIIDNEPSSDENIIKYSELSNEEQKIFRQISINDKTESGEFQNVDYISLDGDYYSVEQKEVNTSFVLISIAFVLILFILFAVLFAIYIEFLNKNEYVRVTIRLILATTILLACLYGIYAVYPAGSEGIVISEEPVIIESTEINYIHINDIPENEKINVRDSIKGGESIPMSELSYEPIYKTIFGEKYLNEKLQGYDYLKTNDEYYSLKYIEDANKFLESVFIFITSIISIFSLMYIYSKFKNIINKRKYVDE